MFLEGQIIEFLDADQLKPGFVRKQERDRLQVIDPRGRHVSVNGDRVAVVHCPSIESEFPTLTRAILEKVRARQSEVDVELLWQSLGVNAREFLPVELAELFFSESTPETTSAVFHALSEDTLFFKRNGLRFVPKTQEQVIAEQTRRVRQREREESRERLAGAVRRLVHLMRNKGEISPELEPIVDRIQGWMRHKTGDEVGAILEQAAGTTHARDVAFEILLHAGRIDPSADRFLTIAGVGDAFPKTQIEAAAALLPAVHDGARLDLRDLPAMTIDDEDTLEVDDAITLREENGEYIVGIHIADASAFVAKGDVLDTEARHRTSTIYLPTIAARMLPERLSTDLASLREGADRLAFTAEVRFDSSFSRVGQRIILSTIHVARRLTYDAADAMIAAGDPSFIALHRIALRLQEERAARGAITFRRPEIKIRVRRDESGEHVKISKLDPNSPSRVVVSEMMVLLNGLAADFASTNSLPVIFRTQEARDPVPLEATPLPEALAFEKLRRTFKRSRLSLTPGLHSGLGLSAYTQASSPIRRYADLVTQRQFTALLQGKPIPHAREELLTVLAAAEAAEQEIRSIEDRSTSYWLLQHLARERMTTVLNAIILDKKGSMELEDYYLRGKLPDPGTAEPGTVVQVMIDHVDPARAEIRFKRS